MFAMTDGEWTFPIWFNVLVLAVMLTVIFAPAFLYWAARVAERKGRSFGAYFTLGLVFYLLSFKVMVMNEIWILPLLIVPLPVLIAYLLDHRHGVYRAPQGQSSPTL